MKRGCYSSTAVAVGCPAAVFNSSSGAERERVWRGAKRWSLFHLSCGRAGLTHTRAQGERGCTERGKGADESEMGLRKKEEGEEDLQNKPQYLRE